MPKWPFGPGALSSAFDSVARIPKPVVAAITGYALGGGCELALACDWRVVASDAKLGQPEIKLGIIPGAGGTQRLPRLVGPAKAKDIIFSGRMVDATEALAIGLADRVVEPEKVYDEALAMVAEYVRGPAQAIRAAKLAIDGGLDMSTSPPDWHGSHSFSRACSPPRTGPRGCPRSWRSANRPSRVVDPTAPFESF